MPPTHAVSPDRPFLSKAGPAAWMPPTDTVPAVRPDRGSPRPAASCPPPRFCRGPVLPEAASRGTWLPAPSEPSGLGVPLGALPPGAASAARCWERDLERGEKEGASHWPSALAPECCSCLECPRISVDLSSSHTRGGDSAPLFRDELSLVSQGLRQPDQPVRRDRQVHEVPDGRQGPTLCSGCRLLCRSAGDSVRESLPPPESWSWGRPFSLPPASHCPGRSETSWARAQLLPRRRPDPRGRRSLGASGRSSGAQVVGSGGAAEMQGHGFT